MHLYVRRTLRIIYKSSFPLFTFIGSSYETWHIFIYLAVCCILLSFIFLAADGYVGIKIWVISMVLQQVPGTIGDTKIKDISCSSRKIASLKTYVHVISVFENVSHFNHLWHATSKWTKISIHYITWWTIRYDLPTRHKFRIRVFTLSYWQYKQICHF